MDQLIRVTVDNGKQLVQARDLHEFLFISQRYSEWIKPYLTMFPENVDWCTSTRENLTEAKKSGRKMVEHTISLEMAKHIAMMSRTDRGMDARNYFLELEKMIKDQQPITLTSSSDILLHTITSLQSAVRIMVDLEKRTKALEEKAEEQEKNRNELIESIFNLPAPTEEAPRVSTRSYLIKYINMYVQAHDITYSEAWTKFYSEFEMAMHIRLPKENRLDNIEDRGMIEKAYDFARKLYPEHR